MVASAFLKEVSFERGEGSGIRCCCGEWREEGDHFWDARMSLHKSAAGSDMQPHSLGQGLPPNVSRRAKRKMFVSSFLIWVIDFLAVVRWRCWRRYADRQSIFAIQMRR